VMFRALDQARPGGSVFRDRCLSQVRRGDGRPVSAASSPGRGLMRPTLSTINQPSTEAAVQPVSLSVVRTVLPPCAAPPQQSFGTRLIETGLPGAWRGLRRFDTKRPALSWNSTRPGAKKSLAHWKSSAAYRDIPLRSGSPPDGQSRARWSRPAIEKNVIPTDSNTQ
jgi:hypothetical protein